MWLHSAPCVTITPFGLPVELTDPVVPVTGQSDFAIAMPGNPDGNNGYVAANTAPNGELLFEDASLAEAPIAVPSRG